ncbi:MAG TPA: glycosyltransferase [Armatimonadota bacterium]|jgi:glycosyltransferase involved in cell wall biosynthesis
MERSSAASPLLSIVIATRNRIPFAISAIQSILEIPDPRLELVVQDNSECRDLEAYVQENVKDTRFRYRYTPPPFSSIDNFNAVLELATGEYVCMIGDDDGVNPEILEAAEWAKRENVDSLGVRTVVHYLWPDTGVPATLYTKATSGCLQISPFSGDLHDADIEKEMRNLVRNGGLYYLDFELPKLYHGLVRRSCLESVRAKTGNYLAGLSPDVFAALSIANVGKRVVVTDYPLTIPGVCGVSSSVREGLLKKPSKELKDAPHFRDRGEYQWCELVPRIYAAEAIWADSAVAALRAMDRDDLVSQLNLPRLAAYCIGANRGVAGPVLRDMFRGIRITGKNPAVAAIKFAWGYLTGPGVRFARRAWNRLLILTGRRSVYNAVGLENMVEVTHALTHYLQENGRSFAECVRRAK